MNKYNNEEKKNNNISSSVNSANDQRCPIVLTGSRGFIGSAVMRAATDSRFSETVQLYTLAHRRAAHAGEAGIETQQGDIDTIPRELFPEQPFVLVHLATKQIDHDGTGFQEVNVKALRKMLDRVPKHCCGVIYHSSLSVYGQCEKDGISEDALVNPETSLAKSRADAEALITAFAKDRCISAYLLRPRFILGKGDRYTLPSWLQMVRKGIIWGSGRQQYSVIDVDDYATIILRLSQYIVGGQNQCSAINETKPHQLVRALHVAYHQPLKLSDIFSRLVLPEPRRSLPFSLLRDGSVAQSRLVRVPLSSRIISLLRSVAPERIASLMASLELIATSQEANIDRLLKLHEEIDLGVDFQRDPRQVLTTLIREQCVSEVPECAS